MSGDMAVPTPFPCLSAPGSLADLWCFFVRFALDRFSRGSHEMALQKMRSVIFFLGPPNKSRKVSPKTPKSFMGDLGSSVLGPPWAWFTHHLPIYLHIICKHIYTSFAKTIIHHLQKYLFLPSDIHPSITSKAPAPTMLILI